MAVEYLVKIEGGRPVPLGAGDDEALSDLIEGATYRAKLTQVKGERSITQNGLFHKVRDIIAENVGMAPEAVKHVLKLKVGWHDTHQAPDGTLHRVPRSLSFNTLSGPEFTELLNRPGGLWDAIAEVFGPALSEAARAEIEHLISTPAKGKAA